MMGEIVCVQIDFYVGAMGRGGLRQVDVARQSLSFSFTDQARLLDAEFRQTAGGAGRNASTLRRIGEGLLDILRDEERLLATDRNQLLGNWISAARGLATTEDERTLYEYNARVLISASFPGGDDEDYGAKAWAGAISTLYLPRWALFLDSLYSAFEQGEPWAQRREAYREAEDELTQKWARDHTSVFGTEPQGDTLTVAEALYLKYSRPTKSLADSYRVVPGADIPGHELLSAWGSEPALLARLCDATPRCAGFTSNGVLKTSVSEATRDGKPCGQGAAYTRVGSADLCTADGCHDYDVAFTSFIRGAGLSRDNHYPDARSLAYVSPPSSGQNISLRTLMNACEAEPRCGGFTVGLNRTLGGWLKAGPITPSNLVQSPLSEVQFSSHRTTARAQGYPELSSAGAWRPQAGRRSKAADYYLAAALAGLHPRGRPRGRGRLQSLCQEGRGLSRQGVCRGRPERADLCTVAPGRPPTTL